MATEDLSCGMWDLVPRPGIEPGPPALGAQSLSHWTTREVPKINFLKQEKFPFKSVPPIKECPILLLFNIVKDLSQQLPWWSSG